MALKTYTVSLGTMTMANFDATIAAAFGYQSTIANDDGTISANPETASQFGRRMMLVFIQEKIKEGIVNTAVETARENAISLVPIIS